MSPRDNVTTQPAWSRPFLPCLRLSLHLQGYGRGWIRLRGKNSHLLSETQSWCQRVWDPPAQIKEWSFAKKPGKITAVNCSSLAHGGENDLHLGKKGVCPSGFSAPMEELWLKTRSLSSHLALVFLIYILGNVNLVVWSMTVGGCTSVNGSMGVTCSFEN